MVHRYSRILQVTPPAVPMWMAYAVDVSPDDPFGYVLEPVILIALVEQWTESFDSDSDVPSDEARDIIRVLKPVGIDGRDLDVDPCDNFFELVTVGWPSTDDERKALGARGLQHLAHLARQR